MIDAPQKALRIAAFDFGSNAIKCQIAEQIPLGYKDLGEHRIVTRLGAAMDEQGRISEAGIVKSLNAAQHLQEICAAKGVTEYLAVGTEALRNAVNADELVSRLERLTGLQLIIISAEEEASLAWRGAISTFACPQKSLLLFDSGGASTELVFSSEAEIKIIQSLPLGAVSLAKDCIHSDPVSDADFMNLQQKINEILKIPKWKGQIVLGTGGGIITCTKVSMAYRRNTAPEINNYILLRCELERQIQLYRASTLQERKQIPGMEAERADIILASAMIALAILRSLKAPGLCTCTRGVRQGLLFRELSLRSLAGV